MSSPETLFELLNMYEVEIPMQQRDYVQGRKGDHATFVRSKLLDAIKKALTRQSDNSPQLDLNFVYGTCDKRNKFIPLDGQQRITTLFLFHLFAFREKDEMTELLHRFSYETRKSSARFFYCLVEHRQDVFKKEKKPSEIITDSQWFQFDWNYDPTIKSCLTMLDAIFEKFDINTDWAELLTNQSPRPIIFHFKDIKELEMDESLYIKLNARGKALTPFENFKARLINRLNEIDELSGNEIKQSFPGKMDSSWTDFFWNIDHQKIDDLFLNFFHIMLVNHGVVEMDDKNWSTSIDFKKVDAPFIVRCYDVLNHLASAEANPLAIEMVVEAIEDDPTTYRDYLYLHAISRYFEDASFDTEGLFQWLRVMKNLIRNSLIDHDYLYSDAFKTIQTLGANKNSILEYLSNGGEIKVFKTSQIKEERTKATIILAGNDSDSQTIYNAERNAYFTGTLNGALSYSYSEDGFDFEKFNLYWNKLDYIFKSKDLSEDVMNLLRRALLCIGDYTIHIGDYKTLCSTNPEENNKTHSLKTLFSNPTELTGAFLDVINIDTDLSGQLKRIIDNSDVSPCDWRYCFIHYPALLDHKSDLFFFSKVYLRIREVSSSNTNDFETIIVPNTRTNGYNYEIFILVLFLLLNERKIDCRLDGEYGLNGKRFLVIPKYYDCIQFRSGRFLFYNQGELVETVAGNNPIQEALELIMDKVGEKEDAIEEQNGEAIDSSAGA